VQFFLFFFIFIFLRFRILNKRRAEKAR